MWTKMKNEKEEAAACSRGEIKESTYGTPSYFWYFTFTLAIIVYALIYTFSADILFFIRLLNKTN